MRPITRLATAAVFTLAAQIPTATRAWAQQGPAADTKVTRELDRLEQAALSAPRLDERLYAPGFMTMHYGRRCSDCRSVPGVVARLVRIYHRSDEQRVRTLIVDLMGIQAETAKAAAFLAQVAKEPPLPPAAPESGAARTGDDRYGPVQRLAVLRLLDLGPDGQKALRALHTEGSVRESRAQATLADLARHGFRRPVSR